MISLVGLIGKPVKASLSPIMFKAAFETTGLEAQYLLMEVDSETLPQVLNDLSLQGWRGFNVTIPHKERVAGLCRQLDPSARAAGAVNTVVAIKDGWRGYNTDGNGAAAYLREEGVSWTDRQLVLVGAGGAARGIATRLAADNPRGVVIANRTVSRAELLAAQVKKLNPGLPVTVTFLQEDKIESELRPPLLVIQTTSLGTGGDGRPVFPFGALTENDVVLDIVYRPVMTPFLERAAASGAKVLFGWGMLLHQGAAAFSLWFDRPAPLEAMRKALIRHLGVISENR